MQLNMVFLPGVPSGDPQQSDADKQTLYSEFSQLNVNVLAMDKNFMLD